MRNLTRDLIEDFVRSQGTDKITFALAEQGIALGRKTMAESIAQYSEAREGSEGKDQN